MTAIGCVFLIPVIFFLIIKVYTFLNAGQMKSNKCLIGKTVLLLGGSTETAYEIALVLSSRGCRLLLADAVALDETKERLIASTGNHNVETKRVDLGSFSSIRNLADDINRTEERLDILINNAEIGAVRQSFTRDKIVNLMQVNHVGPFLLIRLLLDLLKRSSPSKIILTTSSFANVSSLTAENVNKIQASNSICYANSKLCVNITTRALAKRLKNFGITVNCVYPGFGKAYAILGQSERRFELKLYEIVYGFLAPYFGKTPERCAQTALHVALSKSCENATGMHFEDCEIGQHPYKAWDGEFCEEIFAISERLAKLESHFEIVRVQ